MPKSGETRAVRQIKEANAKARARRSSSTTSEVVHETPVDKPHSQPLIHNQSTTPEVVQNTENTRYRGIKEDSLKRFNTVLNNQQIEQLREAGLTDQAITDGLATLTAAYQAEGITPTSSALTQGVLQLHQDAGRG